MIISAFVRSMGEKLPFSANADVLLYDFRHDGHVTFVDAGEVTLKFMGSQEYP